MNRWLAAWLLLMLPLGGCGKFYSGLVYGSVDWSSGVSDVDFTALGMPRDIDTYLRYQIQPGKFTVYWNDSGTAQEHTLKIEGGERLEDTVVDDMLNSGSNNKPQDRVYEWSINGSTLVQDRNELVDDGTTD